MEVLELPTVVLEPELVVLEYSRRKALEERQKVVLASPEAFPEPSASPAYT